MQRIVLTPHRAVPEHPFTPGIDVSQRLMKMKREPEAERVVGEFRRNNLAVDGGRRVRSRRLGNRDIAADPLRHVVGMAVDLRERGRGWRFVAKKINAFNGHIELSGARDMRD